MRKDLQLTTDFDFVYNLLYQDFSKGLSQEDFKKYMIRYGDDYPQTAYLFYEQDILVGCGIVNENVMDHFMISYLLIFSEFRNQKLGKKYFQKLIENQKRSVLWCEESNVNFYQSFGFHNTNHYKLDLSKVYLMINHTDYDLEKIKKIIVI